MPSTTLALHADLQQLGLEQSRRAPRVALGPIPDDYWAPRRIAPDLYLVGQ